VSVTVCNHVFDWSIQVTCTLALLMAKLLTSKMGKLACWQP